MDQDSILLNSTELIETSMPLSFGKIVLYGVEIVLIIQLLMVILNYSRDWKNISSSSMNSEISTISNNNYDSVELKDSDSSNNFNNENEIIEISTFSLKKIISFISVLPLSSFYLILKLSYNVIKFIVYTIFDFVIDFVNYWIINFPERFEEYIINFFNNYIFHSISYMSEMYVIPAISYSFNKFKILLNEIFSEENYDRLVFYIERSAEVIYDKAIIPCFEKTRDNLIKIFNGLWNFAKIYSIKLYAICKLLLNTITIFTLDFFEDVQVAWSGIQWFGINIAQPAASFLEDVLLTLTIRPLAYSLAFFKVFIEKTIKLTYKLIISMLLLIPTLFSILAIFIYKTFDVDAIKHRIHVWMCRWVYLPLWYVVYFIVNYGEKLVVEYIPRVYHTFIRLGKNIFFNIINLYSIAMKYLKLVIYYTYQFLEKAFKLIVEYIPYVHKKSMNLSKNVYNWMKINIFPWFNTIHCIFYVTPLNISRNIFALVIDHVFSENSYIGKNSRILMRLIRQFGEITFSHMIQVGKFIKTFLINVLNIVTPQTINISKKIISLLQKFSLKIYIAVKPIFLKELDIMAKWTEKEVNQINIAIKNFLKDLKLKINEYTTLIYQSIVSENKKLHQSYKNKKEFNKEFIHNKNK